MKYKLGSWLNRARFVFDKNLRMSNIVATCATAYGDRLAFETDHSLSHLGFHGNQLTYRDIDDIVGRLAASLAAVGIQRYDRVGIYKSNHLDYVLMILAAMRIGAIAVPAHGRMPAESFIQYAAYTGCRAVYADLSTMSTIDPAALPDVAWIVADGVEEIEGRQVFNLQSLLARKNPPIAPARMNVHDDVLIVHTSGTTGFPKGVLHSSHSLIRAVRSELIFNILPSRDKAMSAAHFNHHISINGILLSMMAGVSMFAASRHDGEHLLETVERYKPTIFFAFPDIYLNMCRTGLDRFDLSSMRLWISGGDAMHEVHIKALMAHGHGAWKFGGPLRGSAFMELLGTSEVGSAALIKISTGKTKQYARCVGKPSVFSPRVKIADEFGNELARGTVGRLMVKGASLFKGYWNANEKLHGVTADGWWWTGDLGMQDKRGRFYQIDREVDTVYTADGPVYGLPIEEEALKCQDVAEAALIGITHPQRGTVPVLVAHSCSGKPLHQEKVLEQVNAGREPGKKVVAVIDVQTDAEMPRGLTGKVLKRNLRQRYSTYFQS